MAELALQYIWDQLEDKEIYNSENLPELMTLGPYRGYFRQLGAPKIDPETEKRGMIFDFIGVVCTIDHIEFTLRHSGHGGFTLMGAGGAV